MYDKITFNRIYAKRPQLLWVLLLLVFSFSGCSKNEELLFPNGKYVLTNNGKSSGNAITRNTPPIVESTGGAVSVEAKTPDNSRCTLIVTELPDYLKNDYAKLEKQTLNNQKLQEKGGVSKFNKEIYSLVAVSPSSSRAQKKNECPKDSDTGKWKSLGPGFDSIFRATYATLLYNKSVLEKKPVEYRTNSKGQFIRLCRVIYCNENQESDIVETKVKELDGFKSPEIYVENLILGNALIAIDNLQLQTERSNRISDDETVSLLRQIFALVKN